MSRYELFDRARLVLNPLHERRNDVTLEHLIPLDARVPPLPQPDFPALVDGLAQARRDGRPIIWMIGAHVIKQGLSRHVIALMELGWITHLATNGAGIIHDFELAYQAGTSEDVSRYIKQGEFGMWRETGRINRIVRDAAARGQGLGEAVGEAIERDGLPHRDLSVCAAGWRLGVPVTSHVGIGCDIVHQHADCDGAAYGAASYTDFLIFAHAVSRLEGGVYLNVGSAVTGPEVYLKALSMARNVARQEGQQICRFCTAVFDLVPLPDDARDGTAPKSDAQYYYRPWKTILVRTVADGGRSYYFRGDHRVTIPSLYAALLEQSAAEQAA